MEMLSLLDFSVLEIRAFILILVRVAGLFFASPVLGSNLLLSRFKVAFALLMSLILFPMVNYDPSFLPGDLWSFLITVASELFFGLFLGFFFYIVFIGIQFAGQIIGNQIGFGIVSVLDPQSNAQISIIGELKFLTAMLVFLIMNGHYVIIEALFNSFSIVPLARIVFSRDLVTVLIQLTGWVFVYMFKIGAPVLIALYISEIGLGIIARTVPQMNIFIIGFPLKIGLGLYVLALATPIWVFTFEKALNYFSQQWIELIRLFALAR